MRSLQVAALKNKRRVLSTLKVLGAALLRSSLAAGRQGSGGPRRPAHRAPVGPPDAADTEGHHRRGARDAGARFASVTSVTSAKVRVPLTQKGASLVRVRAPARPHDRRAQCRQPRGGAGEFLLTPSCYEYLKSAAINTLGRAGD